MSLAMSTFFKGVHSGIVDGGDGGERLDYSFSCQNISSAYKWTAGKAFFRRVS